MSGRKPIPAHIQSRITKIFVTNLPEGCSGADLATQVRVFGQIYDLYIARKRDKSGNQFGFISFLDVKDKEELLRNLKGIRMGDYKLLFNIARFVLEEGEINTGAEKPGPKTFGNPNMNRGTDRMGGKSIRNDTSFRDLFEGKNISIDNNVQAFSTLHGRAIIARMIDLEALKSIYVILNGICPGFGKVQYLGGLDLLISFEDAELAGKVIESAKLLNDKFYSVVLWEGQSLSFERLAWLKIQGVPLNLLTNEVLNTIGGKFGKVVHKAKKMETELDLSFEYVGILAGDGKRITEEVVLNWMNRKFRVWVTEELGEWIPDFDAVTIDEVVHDKASDEEKSGDDIAVEIPVNSPVKENEIVDDVMELPEHSPVKEAGVTADGVINEETIMEKIDSINEANYGQSIHINVDNLNMNLREESFVPATSFDFDQLNEENYNVEGPESNIVKRKKFKKTDLGRPSCAYTSSNESQKVVKKPKNVDNDIFGLNSLLGITDDGPSDEGPFDLNSDPSIQPDNIGDSEKEKSLAGEVEATKGLGPSGKAGWIKRLKSDLGVSFIGIQETVSSNVNVSLVSNFWGGLGFDFEVVDAIGNSGGLLSIWDPKFFKKDMVVKDNNFLLVSGLLADGCIRLNLLNVYAPQTNVDKRVLWDKINHTIQMGQGWWIVLGDFNAARDPSERKNSCYDQACARDFNDFLDEVGLREYDLKGMNFTYLVNRQGECKLSRIDRVFVCDNIFNKWPNACVRALNREFSDHAPLFLSLCDTNFGPKPFRWFDSWIDRQVCEDIVNSVLVGWRNHGPADINLMRKLKDLRMKLNRWIVKSRKKDNELEFSLKKDKEEMERLMEQKDLEESELWVWSECCKNLHEIELLRTRDLKQKSRVKWAALGDENTSLFHNVVNGRKARNSIPGLEVNGR
ncbi:RNA-directed DNA polymerase, eukaryota [Artemisia annua]|uniref:RNA-directed DNA polymerase, eukaryota n=1 Tax=Artemisia annua TaxID=35608 RepID=A0A2U1P0N5_ARTAN|nr:RNA-directed DNA polymerase, eukaryota [Artemisia annua]